MYRCAEMYVTLLQSFYFFNPSTLL
jgi:hypothetical protein